MDERLEKALQVANFTLTFNNQKELIKQQFKIDIEYHENGHRFVADLELINFLSTLVNLEINQTVLIDENGNPYQVSDVAELRKKLLNNYFQASNKFYTDFNELKKKRTVNKLTLDDK